MDYIGGVLVQREFFWAGDNLLNEAKTLVKAYLDPIFQRLQDLESSTINGQVRQELKHLDNALLTDRQMNLLEGIGRIHNLADIKDWIRRQGSKAKEDEGWKYKANAEQTIAQSLIVKLDEVYGTKTDQILENVQEASAGGAITIDREISQDVKIRMVRTFIRYFTTSYIYEADKIRNKIQQLLAGEEKSE